MALAMPQRVIEARLQPPRYALSLKPIPQRLKPKLILFP